MRSSPSGEARRAASSWTTSRSPASTPRSCAASARSEEHTSELQSRQYLVCRLLLEKKKNNTKRRSHFLSLQSSSRLSAESNCSLSSLTQLPIPTFPTPRLQVVQPTYSSVPWVQCAS